MGDKSGTPKRISDRNNDLACTLTYKDVVYILEVIDNSDSKELSLEVGDLKLNLIRQ